MKSICTSCDQFDGKTIKRKLKELIVKQYLGENNVEINFYDKIYPGGCSKRRPDFVISREWGRIIIEVDEFQHNRKNYPCECEITRMKQIYFDIGEEYGKVIFIRYNPDNYIPSIGKPFETLERLKSLVYWINRYSSKEPENYLTVQYLFYDGYTPYHRK